MLITSVRVDKNNKWKRNTQKSKDRKEQGGTEAILEGWELNDFFELLRFSTINR